MSEEVILYDIPSKDPRRSWSLNPWKSSSQTMLLIPVKSPKDTDQCWIARLILNLKGIPYKTEWLEYPDIAPTLKPFGIPPSEPPASAYSCPTIRISDKYVMDSRKIADVLEKEQPSPSLHLDSSILKKVEGLAPQCIMPLGPVFMPRIPRLLLNPRSAEYFERTREERFGMTLSQLEKEKGGEGAWKAAEPKWKELGTLLKAEGGPFFMGKTGKHVGSLLPLRIARTMSAEHLDSVICRLNRCRCIALFQSAR